MNDIDFAKLGDSIRKIRKEMGLKIKDLSDENISTATISAIERGANTVSSEKIKYLYNKLKIDPSQLSWLIKEDEEEKGKRKLQFMLVENVIDLVGPEFGLRKLKKLNFKYDQKNPTPFKYHLKGRMNYEKKEWKRARSHYLKAIDSMNESLSYTNLKASCYLGLSRIEFYEKGDLKQALEYTQKGIDAFIEDGERTDTKYSLFMGKAFYLSELNDTSKAKHTLDKLFVEINDIKNPEVLTNMYEMNASFLCDLEQYEEATENAIKGMNIARMSKMHERSLDLMTSLGRIHLSKGDLESAEFIFLSAISLKEKIKKEHLFTQAYTFLGLLYKEEKQWREAEKWLIKSTKVGKSKTVKYMEALTALGDCYLEQNFYDRAINPYKTAFDQAQELQLYQQFPTLLLKLIQCYKYTDDEEFNKCMELLYDVNVKLHAIGGAKKMKQLAKEINLIGNPPGD